MARRKRDVCPECDAHCEQVRVPGAKPDNPFLTPYRCTRCGRTHAMCDLRCSTAGERAEAYERKKAYHRRWYAENAEHCRRYSREYLHTPENNARINARNRKRWREDPEWRERRLRASAEYDRSHPEKRREINARYYRRHREEILYRQNVKALRMRREERP